MASPSCRDATPGPRSLDREKHGQEEDHLNSDMWARLPEYLIEGILAKLPFSSLVRFCSVCKRWRDLILCSEFFPRYTSGHGCLVCCEVDSDGDLILTTFNSSRGSWETVPLQFLQVDWCGLETMAVSAGGLVCFRSGGLLSFVADEECEYIMCNPLTKYGKRLQLPCTEGLTVTDQPSMPIPDPACWRRLFLEVSLLVGMVVDSHTGHFKVILGNFIPGFQGTTLIYDSRADSWNKAADIRESVLKEYLPKSQPTTCTCKGDLYFYFKIACGSSEDRLLKYDVEEQAWSWILMPKYETNPYVEQSRNIIECNGEILLVTPTYVFREIDQMVQMTFQVFKLQDAGPTWVLTNCLPFSRVREDMPVGTQIDCLGHGDVMFFIRRNVDRSLDPKKISVRKWFHNAATNSDVISNWVDYLGDKESPDFQILMPSTIPLK